MQYTVLRYNETRNDSYISVHGDLDYLKSYFGFNKNVVIYDDEGDVLIKEPKTIFHLIDALNKRIAIEFGVWPKPTYKLFIGYRGDGSVISI